MPHYNDQSEGSRSQVAEDLLAALARLQSEGSGGRLKKISISAVAAEAGHSRTLIGHNSCPYPDVRRAIKDAIKTQKKLRNIKTAIASCESSEETSDPSASSAKPDSGHLAQVVADLKADISHLKQKIKIAAIKIVAIDDENLQLRLEIRRLQTELTRRRQSEA